MTWNDDRTIVERELIAGRVAPEDLPPVRLDPVLWMPPVIAAKPEPDPIYLAYRAENRAFRRAFGRGERYRKTLLACGKAKIKEMS